MIPCYNPDPSVFKETLQSVLASTFRNLDIIVVDDGSTNKDFLKALSAVGASDRISVIEHPLNRGLSAARNTGVEHSETPYFLQLDADDLIDPTFIEKCVWALESHPEWAFCNSWSVAFGAESYRWNRGFDSGAAFLDANQVTATAVIRRDADRLIGGHDETIRDGCEDWDYWLKMASHGYWGGTIPEYLTHYRKHDTPTYWPNRDDPILRARVQRQLRRRYPHLRRGAFPTAEKLRSDTTAAPLLDAFPFQNSLPRSPGRTRMLMLVPWMTLGGVDRFNLSLVEQLGESAFDTTICATADGPSPWSAEFARHTPDVFIMGNFLRLEDYPRFISHLIESRQVDIVFISNSMLGYRLLPYLRSRYPGVTFVDFIHMVETDRMNGGYARFSVDNQERLDLSIVGSQQIKSWMGSQGAEEERIQVSHINVDTSQWNPEIYDRRALRRSWNVPEDATVILYAARLAAQKRPQLLAEVVSALSHGQQRFLCLVAGDGPERGWLEGKVKKDRRLRDRMRVLGAVEPDRMPELMALSDIFFLPSQDEGIALTIYEAMAMGLAVVGADVGGQRELVTLETGFLVPHGADEIAVYLAVLKRLVDDPDLRRIIGRAARERVRAEFNLDQMVSRMGRLLHMSMTLSRAEPRADVSLEQGSQAALLALDTARQERAADRLWGEQQAAWVFGQDAAPVKTWRRLLLKVKVVVLRPIYIWGLAHGMGWLVSLRDIVYRALGRRLADQGRTKTG